MLFAIALFFAQAYGCGNYSASSYSQCPASSQTTPVSTPLPSQPSAAQPTTTIPPAQPAETATGQPHPQPTIQPVQAIATTSYTTIFIFSFIGAVLLAGLWWLIAIIRRRRQNLSHF